jgi:RimJ/RimL family protein N-acetyltransferase
MYQIGLKLWSTNTDHYLQEAKRLYADKVFSYIELYIVPDTLERISLWKEAGMPFILHNAHFMQGFNLAKKECEERNYDIYRQTRQYADELNAKYIIFHGGIDGSVEETARQMALLEEPRALIENKPYRALPNRMGGKICRGYNFDELRLVMDKTGCGFCLDFGHAVCAANSMKRETYEYIGELFKLNPAMFHLTDVDDMNSEYDSHPHLGSGKLAITRIAAMIPCDAIITLETDKGSRETLDDFNKDSQIMNKFSLQIRKAKSDDMKIIFELSNDDEVRNCSFNPEKIKWEDHQQWFTRTLNDPGHHFYIISNQLDEFVGQARFERLNAGQYEVSFSIAAEFRGKGIAANVLKLACLELKKENSRLRIIGWIKNDNLKSLKCFNKAGFKTVEEKSDRIKVIYE